jgi:hypothetical protein
VFVFVELAAQNPFFPLLLKVPVKITEKAIAATPAFLKSWRFFRVPFLSAVWAGLNHLSFLV